MARFLEICADHLFGIGLGLVARFAQNFGHPKPHQFIASGLGLEFHVLIMGVFRLECVFTIVKGAHGLPFCFGQICPFR